MQGISIKICASPLEAPNYNTDGCGIKAARLEEAIIVRNGTQQGNSTIDLVFSDENGNRFVALITSRLLKSVTDLSHAFDTGQQA